MQAVVALVVISSSASAFQTALRSYHRFNTKVHEVPRWLRGDSGADVALQIDTLTVRFINTPTGKDVIVPDVEAGSNLLAVGDKVGIQLPRACRTGLCGSCTCEVIDPNAVKTETNPKAGYATVRACSTRCFLPDGLTEMVVDVKRMRKIKKRIGRGAEKESTGDEDDEDFDGTMVSYSPHKTTLICRFTNTLLQSDPMSRFGDNWEVDFKPSWELPTNVGADGSRRILNSKSTTVCYLTISNVNRVITRMSSASSQKLCTSCNGSGRVQCYACKGSGTVMVDDHHGSHQCFTCVGIRTCGCGYCRGTGMVNKKSGKF